MPAVGWTMRRETRRRQPVNHALLEIGTPPPARIYLRRLWARRDFIWAVPLGQLRVQTQNSILGGFWHLLNPLLTAALYYVVFGVIFGGVDRIPNYPAFLVIGIFTFLYTSRSVSAGARAVTSNMGLVTQINFPRLALPSAAAVAETLSHGFALIALFLTLPLLGISPALTWFAVVPVLLLQATFNVGVAMVAARVAFQYRDVENLLPHLLRFWMYGSGVFFTIDFVVAAVGDLRWTALVFSLNPAYIHMTLMRSALMGSEASTVGLWAGAAAWGIATVVGGFFFFRRREVEYGRG
jgi:teichoic acid transport system permease protein